jgi:hypothetical protein
MQDRLDKKHITLERKKGRRRILIVASAAIFAIGIAIALAIGSPTCKPGDKSLDIGGMPLAGCEDNQR